MYTGRGGGHCLLEHLKIGTSVADLEGGGRTPLPFCRKVTLSAKSSLSLGDNKAGFRRESGFLIVTFCHVKLLLKSVNLKMSY